MGSTHSLVALSRTVAQSIQASMSALVVSVGSFD